MSWFSSIVVGLLTAVVGLFSAGFLANLNVRWYRISSFEGGSGYYVVGIALLGGLVGLIVGIVCARVAAGWADPHFLKGIGLAFGAMTGLVFVIGVICWLAADLPPQIDGKSLELAIEVKGPLGFTVPEATDEKNPTARVSLTRGRTQPGGPIRLNEATQVEGRWIIPATVPLMTSSSDKHLHAYINDTFNLVVWLPLRAHPKKDDLQWSRWVEAGWTPGQPKPEPEANFHLRWRVQLIEPPPPSPPLTSDELADRQSAREEAEFKAIPADAPIKSWLPYTKYGADEARLRTAIENIQSREHFPEELGALMTGDDHETAAAAMWMVRHLDLFPPELNDQVNAAGAKIVTMIRTFNATPAEQDPGMQGAADVSVRFHAWMEAVRTLRKHSDGDFTPVLGEILELSRVRDDSHAMRADVRRVASYYMKEWAGVEPLPGDPPPK